MCKSQNKSSPSTNQHPAFYRPDPLPVPQVPNQQCQSTEGKYATLLGLAYPKLHVPVTFITFCIDTVGWVTGRGSGLQKAECWFVDGDDLF